MSKQRGSPQIAWGGWVPDYPAASGFIQPLFSCESAPPNGANYTHFCDRRLDRKIDDAVELEQTNLAAANRRWVELDREITNKALIVPLYNVYGEDFVSKRVGNYQYNPQLGTLLSQMWVR